MVKALPPFQVETPEYSPGEAVSVAPFGHSLWLDDYEYWDQLGRDPMQLRKMWLITNAKERMHKFGEIIKDYPKARHRRQMLRTVIARGDVEAVRCLVGTGLLVHPDIQQAKKDKRAYEDAQAQPDFEPPKSLPDIPDPINTPVHAATFQGRLEILKILIEDGKTQVDCRDEFGRTPLHAAAEGGHVECARYLLDQGADPIARLDGGEETKDFFGKLASADALEFAAGSGSLELIRMLLDHPFHGSMRKRKYSKDSQPGVWVTPLAIHMAATSRKHEVLELLLERGAYPMTDQDGRTKGDLLTIAEKETMIEATKMAIEQGDLESTKLLLSYQYPVDNTGELLPYEVPEDLHKIYTYGAYNAMTNDMPDKFKFIHGFGIEQHDRMSMDKLPPGQTLNLQHLLDKACGCGSLTCVKMLIDEFGADPHKHRSHTAVKPLYVAAANDHAEVVRYLLEDQSVDIHAGNGRYIVGPTALWIAIRLHSFASAELLLQHGGPLDHIDEELKRIEQPTTAILRTTIGDFRPTVRLETLDNAKEFLDFARHNCMNLMTGYIRLEFTPADQPLIDKLALRRSDEQLREMEKNIMGEAVREFDEEGAAKTEDLEQGDPRRVLPPLPTIPDREALVKKDDDLVPEFRPFARGA